MSHEGRMARGKYNSDNNINLNNADTKYFLDNNTVKEVVKPKKKKGVSEK